MSLFSDFQQGQIIEKPRQTTSYKKILDEKKEDPEKKRLRERKELCAKKRLEMPEDEFLKWRQKERYQQNKKKVIKYNIERYHRGKEEDEAMLDEIYKSVYDPIPDPVDYDEYYTEKFRKDDMVGGKYVFARWSSRLKRINRATLPKQHTPFRLAKRVGVNAIYSHLGDIEYKAYEYLKPHLDEIRGCALAIGKRQSLGRYPIWLTDGKLKELIEESNINHSHLCDVADGMRRDKYIVGQTYLGRNSFIFGDVIVTQTGHTFRIALGNNLPWLTKDTVEEIHSLRVEWWKKKGKVAPPIYIVNDAYLIKVQPNEREKLFFIVPT